MGNVHIFYILPRYTLNCHMELLVKITKYLPGASENVCGFSLKDIYTIKKKVLGSLCRNNGLSVGPSADADLLNQGPMCLFTSHTMSTEFVSWR